MIYFAPTTFVVYMFINHAFISIILRINQEIIFLIIKRKRKSLKIIDIVVRCIATFDLLGVLILGNLISTGCSFVVPIQVVCVSVLDNIDWSR